jgi:MurNAc alpha-1-phosphate uridylyltransferase
MKAMILAAGDGKRMRPLTDNCPKPLLDVGGKPLMQYHIESLRQVGITELVINHGRLGNMIEEQFGDGSRLNVKIQYSPEGESPLETAGGIKSALALLGSEPFITVNADVWTDFNFDSLPDAPNHLAHLVMVDNPQHNQQGDFYLNGDVLHDNTGKCLTFSGIALYHPDFFLACPDGPYPLAPLLRQAIVDQLVSAEHFRGRWVDVGTPDRLNELHQAILAK